MRLGNNTTGVGNNVTMNGNDRSRASAIERQLESVSGIGDCSVIVSGDTALVGLMTNGNNAGNSSQLRTTIERRVMQIDNTIKNVTVTDSPDMLTRMGKLGTGDGMTTNFMQDFRNMINNIGNGGR